MYRNLFVAWYCLAVFALSLVSFFAAEFVFDLERARAAFGLLGLLGLLPIFFVAFFRKENSDERDLLFLQKSAGIGMSYGFATIFILNVYFWLEYSYIVKVDSVPVDVLWIPALCGLLIGMLIFSVLLILFYYKGENADKESGI